MISVTGVDVTDDLSEATVSISVLPAGDADLTLHGVRHAAGHIRSVVAERVEVRRVPRLSFRLDASLKKEAEVLAAIKRSRREEIEPREEESET